MGKADRTTRHSRRQAPVLSPPSLGSGVGPDDGEEALPFQSSARLEVSGILNGTESQFATRVKQKLKQTEVSDRTKLTAYAVVVEFGQPQAEVGER